ncbi:uncharacterized protein LOC141631489 [Silene latifolia]|uniref:uncharacterized protein LOC141631489 n=1 Tax=Silene latifolia TaxID=37657 RepID=UPI003D76B4B6
MLGVLETRIKEKNVGKIIKITVIPLISNAQFIHCALTHHATSHKLFITMVYGSNNYKEREDLWLALSSIKSTVTDWIVLGDFNVVRDVSERVSPSPPDLNDILDFNAYLLNCHLEDVGGSGCEYTWSNKQDDSTRGWSKLDKAPSNLSWFSHFPATYTAFLPSGVSDHSPVLVNIFEDPSIKSRFSFINYWISHPSYRGLISQAWQHYVAGTAIYSDLSSRVTEAKAALALLACQQELQSCPLSQDLILQERDLLDEYNSLKSAEISMVQQKSKVDNISHGDCSTKYFFSRIQERKQQHIIGRILDRNGIERTGLTEVAEGFVDYYGHLLGTSMAVSPLDSDFIQQGPCILAEDHDQLIKLVTTDEIKLALFGIGSGKIPRPDVNGGAHGFFKGQNGIRQRDPLSPYLFVLSMKILSRYLRKLDTKPMVSLHPKCAKLKLTYLVFADDIMLFTRGDVSSVKGAVEILENFSSWSGLRANIHKTEVYFRGVLDFVKA